MRGGVSFRPCRLTPAPWLIMLQRRFCIQFLSTHRFGTLSAAGWGGGAGRDARREGGEAEEAWKFARSQSNARSRSLNKNCPSHDWLYLFFGLSKHISTDARTSTTIRTHIHRCIHIHTSTHTDTHTHTHTHTYTCTRTCTHACTQEN